MLKLAAADARRPFGPGHISSVLEQRPEDRVWIQRQDCTGMGRRVGVATADTRRPFGLGHVGSVLERRPEHRVRIQR